LQTEAFATMSLPVQHSLGHASISKNTDKSLMPHDASQCQGVLGRTKSHRNRHNLTGSSCTIQMHSFRRNCLPTCSNLEQVLVWEQQSSGSAAVLESAEVLESVQPLLALGWVRRAEP